MGSIFSRSSSNSAPAPPADSNSPSADDLSSYLAAVNRDPELRVFDSELQDRASRVIKSVADSVEVRSLSFDSLRQVTDCLIDMNHDVVDVILKCKEDIWDNPELFGLVNEYFKYSVQMLGFFNALDKCLKRARDRQLIIRVTLGQFEEESENGFSVDASDKYVKTLQELKNFKEAGDTFSTEFFSLFQLVYEQQLQMFEKLQLKKRNLDKKLKQVEVYRKVSTIIFAATFVAVIICSVVAAAVAAPAWVTALAAAASAPMGGVGKWFNSLFKKYENELKGQRELVSSIQARTFIAISDLESIKHLIDKLEVHTKSMLTNAEFALGHPEAVALVMEEIKKKLSELTEAIDELTNRTEICSREVMKARTVILQRMAKYPSSSSS